eukprot:5428419-Alexandrium_andersonii.AAC.1
MSASLVGSEMCIRDSPGRPPAGASGASSPTGGATTPRPPRLALPAAAVSYTHLTLPTICSV